MPIIDSFPDPFIPPSTTSRWKITLDILPDDPIDYDIWQSRVRVGATEVLVMPGMTVDDADLSRTASFELVDFDDKDLFTSSAQVDVGIGKMIDGDWDEASMIWEIVDGYVESLNENRSGTPQQPGDAVTVTIAAVSDSKLNKTSEAGLIIYDSNRTTISDDELKPIKDANGNTYTPVVVAIPGLKVSHLFQRVFVTECGFDSYETNLPEAEWPIQRYSVGMGQRFYDGLRSILGVYNAVVKPTDTTIGIYDSYTALPSGVPAAKSITVDHAEQIGTSKQNAKLDALMVQFAGIENNYDFTTPRFEYPEEGDGSIRKETERIIIEFRKRTTPGNSVVVREELNIEDSRTFSYGTEIGRSSEVWEFDGQGRHTGRTVIKEALVTPTEASVSESWSGTFQGITHTVTTVLNTSAPSLRKVAEDYEKVIYAPYPYNAKSDYVARRTSYSTGAIAVDIDNPMPDGTPFFRELYSQFRQGNVQVGQFVIGSARIRTRDESAVPLKDGQNRIAIREVDQVTGQVILDVNEIRPGEITTSGVATNQEIPVFADDVVGRTAERMEDFPIGELPLKFGLPLARRALIFRQTKGREMSLAHIGYDKTLQVGTTASAYDRDDNLIGNFLIEGRRVICASGLVLQLTGREIANTAEPLQRIGPVVNSIESAGVQIWVPIPVECEAGFELAIEPGTVNDLTVEVAVLDLLGDPGLYWNLETDGPLDLSSFAGTTRDLQFRFTAGAVSVPTRVQFDILTRE